MLQSLTAGLADISFAELALIAGMALVASILGGVAGYGTGALLPLVLVPIVGAEPVVPILSLSALFTNSGRIAAFRHLVDGRRAWIVLVAAVPTCALGAWGYTRLTGVGAALVIGAMLIASVPLRRLMRRRGLALSDRALAITSLAWGPLAGGTVGAGIILLSLLMAAGLEGAAVVATDAVISIGIGLAKLTVFGIAGAVSAKVVAVALLIGTIAVPGAFLARALVARLPLHVHTTLLDAVVIMGGAVMIGHAFTG
ncbi:MAG: TSUP family transporter [Hyphomicrobiales bacterium]|nr:TSUP family transporter [Hyphomicrobiales bacterium]